MLQAWLDQGVDASKGTWELLKSAFRLAEEAQGGRGFAFNVECSSWGMVPVREATFLLFFGSKGGGSAQGCFSFSEFWSFGADDRCAAVASAALRGDLDMLKDICDSDVCSIFISPGVGVEEANLPDVLEHWTLCEYVELAFLRAVAGSSRRCCRGWRGENPWKPSTLHSVP